jgi:hypothetical protein
MTIFSEILDVCVRRPTCQFLQVWYVNMFKLEFHAFVLLDQ